MCDGPPPYTLSDVYSHRVGRLAVRAERNVYFTPADQAARERQVYLIKADKTALRSGISDLRVQAANLRRDRCQTAAEANPRSEENQKDLLVLRPQIYRNG